MSIWKSSDRYGRVCEGLTMLRNQGLIDGLDITRTDEQGRRHESPFTVQLPTGTITLTEDEAAMFLLGASTVFFGWYAHQPVSRFNRT